MDMFHIHQYVPQSLCYQALFTDKELAYCIKGINIPFQNSKSNYENRKHCLRTQLYPYVVLLSLLGQHSALRDAGDCNQRVFLNFFKKFAQLSFGFSELY